MSGRGSSRRELLRLGLGFAFAGGAGLLERVFAEPEPVRGRIAVPGVSGTALIRNDRLLLTSRGGEVLLLDDGPARLASGRVEPRPEERLSGDLRARLEVEDLQDAAWDGTGHAYLAGSHARTPLGDAPEARYRLARLHFDATGKLLEVRTSGSLLRAIVEEVPFLADAIRRPPARAGLDVEGLACSPEGHLLVGLRAPTITESQPRPQGGQEDAVVLRIKNPEPLFEPGAPPAELGDTVKLDLHGQGIRGMTFDPGLKCWWIVSGLSVTPTHPVRSPWSFWRWDGRATPIAVSVPGAEYLEAPTAVARIGAGRLLLVDGGSEESRYLIVQVP